MATQANKSGIVKWLLIIAAVVGFGFGVNYLRTHADMFAPEEKENGLLSEVEDDDPAEATKSANSAANTDTQKKPVASTVGGAAVASVANQVKTIRVGVNTWGGFAGGQLYNNGFAANEASLFFKNFGFKVEFVLLDDPDASRAAFKTGAIDLLWGTADTFPTEAGGFYVSGVYAKILFQVDWSDGGDALVVFGNINSMKDLTGKKIAYAPGTPSHTLLLTLLKADQMEMSDIVPVKMVSAPKAAEAFKNELVDAAVVWSPDDLDCVKSRKGSKVLLTSKGTKTIADVFYAQKPYIEANAQMLAQFEEGWFRGADMVNNDPAARARAIEILMAGYNLDKELMTNAINTAYLCNYKDNMEFFGMVDGYTGMTGQRLYDKMKQMYSKVGLVDLATTPSWRDVTDLSILQSVKMTLPPVTTAPAVVFTPPTEAIKVAPAVATTMLPINFDIGSAVLDQNAKTIMEMGVVDTVKSFEGYRVRVSGHTDNTGDRLKNQKLSKARAQAAVDYLIEEYNYDPNRFIVEGFGPDKPVDSNTTPVGREKNRRVEFSIIQQ